VMPTQALIDLINSAPEPLREYIHDIEAKCDPAGDIRTIALLRENQAALLARIKELEQEKAWQQVATIEPPRGNMVLLWDTFHNVVRVGCNEVSGWHVDGPPEGFKPHKWQRIHF
jgi:hypothetical protein